MGCAESKGSTDKASNVEEDRRYSARPSPLTEADIKSRIECSEHTEIMKGVQAEGGVTYDISYAYLTQRGYYPHGEWGLELLVILCLLELKRFLY